MSRYNFRSNVSGGWLLGAVLGGLGCPGWLLVSPQNQKGKKTYKA